MGFKRAVAYKVLHTHPMCRNYNMFVVLIFVQCVYLLCTLNTDLQRLNSVCRLFDQVLRESEKADSDIQQSEQVSTTSETQHDVEVNNLYVTDSDPMDTSMDAIATDLIANTDLQDCTDILGTTTTPYATDLQYQRVLEQSRLEAQQQEQQLQQQQVHNQQVVLIDLRQWV